MSVLENLKPELLWKQFDEIRKIPRCSKYEEQIREYILDFAKKHDLDAKTDDAGNVVISKPASEGMEDKPIVVLQGHMDMVCEKNSDVDFDFATDPIQLKRDGDVLTADGTTLGADDGIGVATSLALLEDDSLKLGALEALFTVDEETGLTGAFALGSDMLKGRILLNLDSEDWGVLTVGCAGGGNSEITLPIKTEDAPEEFTGLSVRVSGLRGGHSGVDVHEQRGNAIKILARLIWKTLASFDIVIFDFHGGDKHNAIPREASAVIGVKSTDQKNIKKLLQNEADAVAKEIKPIDPNFSLSIDDEDATGEILTKDSAHSLLNLLHALPHGVEKMSYDIDGLVQTSTNLAKVSMESDSVEIMLSSRSSNMTELQNLRDRIHAMTKLAGGSVEEEEPYPGWQPNMDSKILKLSKKLYKDKYGKDPVVEAIHAGLECGIIGEKFDGMDMISIGPTIKYPHSPEEQVHISTVDKFYEYVVDIIKNV